LTRHEIYLQNKIVVNTKEKAVIRETGRGVATRTSFVASYLSAIVTGNRAQLDWPERPDGR
jgi:hypothetical protein